MKGESERYISKGKLGARAFNPLAREFGREIRPGEWVLLISKVRKVYGRVIDGRERVNYLGPKGLDELKNFFDKMDKEND